MKSLRVMLLLVAAGGWLAGCSQPRPKPIAGCNYKVLPLTVGPKWHQPWRGPDAAAATVLDQAETPEVAELGRALQARRLRNAGLRRAAITGVPRDQFLALSGGGQHGAFGAGFFYGMQAAARAKHDTLPDWDIVTGVSTGSLQSTLLFLANQPVPSDRGYGWVDGPMSGKDGATGLVVTPGESNVGDLVLAYSIAQEADLMRTRRGGAIAGALLKGSTASFAPLRDRLLQIMTVGTLRAVGQEWVVNKRQLFVGVSNLDDGAGYGIDMTELAARTLSTRAAGDLARIQGCYVDALLASASVPPGVPPVTLQTDRSTNLYMDGGARFGMFLEPVLAARRAAGEDRPADVTLMVNTSMAAGPWNGDGTPTQRWSVVSAALRAVNLMETQVYVFSAAAVADLGIARGGLNMAVLGNGGIPGGEPPETHRFDGKSCSQWQAIDARAKPLQFYPRYMACTADYGRSRGVIAQWNHRMPAQP
ncbi:patatin-like phospholipase family protein [Sphingomonas sp.]|uniref:patatin-like phospholipase family protein n=1 Tax=Sphingomonas sp. TaxID=28214 RepID=UPI0028B24D54|nr:patatin-like phospholipase family protein [Sphingomonas sp.]